MIEYLPDKALSIRQPWVWAILNAGKNIENRSRRFHYRGPICLHASRHRPHVDDLGALHEVFDLIDPIDQIGPGKFSTSQHTVDWARSLQAGGIVGTANIVDCIDHNDSPWFFGPFGLVLEDIKPIDFIAVKGALGLFDWRKNLTQIKTEK